MRYEELAIGMPFQFSTGNASHQHKMAVCLKLGCRTYKYRFLDSSYDQWVQSTFAPDDLKLVPDVLPCDLKGNLLYVGHPD